VVLLLGDVCGDWGLSIAPPPTAFRGLSIAGGGSLGGWGRWAIGALGGMGMREEPTWARVLATGGAAAARLEEEAARAGGAAGGEGLSRERAAAMPFSCLPILPRGYKAVAAVSFEDDEVWNQGLGGGTF